MGRRIILISSVFLVAYGTIVFRLYNLQIAKGSYYQAKADSQFSAAREVNPERGSIFMTDRNGNKIAVASNKDYPIVYAVPKMVEDAKESAERLSVATGLDAAKLAKDLSLPLSYRLILKKTTDIIAGKVQDLNIRGIYVDSGKFRYYPFGPLAAQTLGFTNIADDKDVETGTYGLEKKYDELLTGRSGKTDQGKIIPAQAGQDLVTTLDPNIERQAEQILDKLVSKYEAKGGCVIAMEPKTGKILAMAGTPGFDPNSYSDSPVENFTNPTVQQLYEPGSVFKVLTMAAALDAKVVTPETTYYDSGKLELSGRTIQNWDHKAHGTVTMTNVIELSLNTGAAFAESKLGNENFKRYLNRFGLAEKTGVDLPGEATGDLRRLMSPHAPAIVFATASYGQGVAVTPLRVISSINAIANQGIMMRPYLNQNAEPVKVGQPISKDSASMMTKIMISAVDKAKVAKIPGYALAGKTGTAFVPDFKSGGYTDKVINTYVGFGPASDPKFILLIKLNEPAGAPLAGETVVPAFREMSQFILNYYNIPPDRPDEVKEQ